MKTTKLEGKTVEEILEQIESDVIYKELEDKKGLFKGTTKVIEIVELSEISDFVKEYLSKTIELMGIEANIEVKLREKIIIIAVYSKENQLLIGKNGKTIDAIRTVLKQAIYKEIGMYPRVNLDIGDYKKKKEHRIERTAKQIARDVAKSKVEAKLDPMNSYERRIVHSALNDNKYVTTESAGVEPERYIIIKPKEN